MIPRPLRICFFNRSYHPDRAATGQLLTELAEDLVARWGHEVWVVAGPPPGPSAAAARSSALGLVAREAHRGVRILRARGTRLPPRSFGARATNYLTYFASACRAALALPPVDVVVALTDPPIIGLAARLAARRSAARFVLICQDVFPEVAALLEDIRSEWLDRILDRISRGLIRRADQVVAIGETMRERLVSDKGADPARVIVIHNWADTSAVAPGPRRNALSIARGLADRFVVMHSGNVGLSQDLDTLLDAAERLRPHRDIAMVIAGEGVRRAALEARCHARGLDNVRFLPSVPREQLSEHLAGADVLVVSLAPGLAGYIVPSKLYGILAAGRPYVAAVEEATEVAAITRAHGSGLLAQPGNAGALARRILTLHDDRELCRKLGDHARRAAHEFDRAGQVARYEELFRRVARFAAAEARPPRLKRPFDLAVAVAGLVCSAPLWAVIAAAIKLEDGGPVFHVRERVGKGGRRFRSWKFRSMVAGAEEHGPVQARELDPRITRVGRILRRTALDELPQLLNIAAGDMSFVGPRPLLPEEVEVGQPSDPVPLDRIAGADARQRVRPGLTGIAQVFAPRDIPRRQKFRLDRLYVERQGFWLDLRLIALSFRISIAARWERRGDKLRRDRRRRRRAPARGATADIIGGPRRGERATGKECAG